MVVPEGYPPWMRLNTFETYGGRLDKKNFGDLAAINGQTDVDAKEFVALTRDVSAASRTAPWAVLKVQLNDSTTSDPTLIEYWDMSGGAAPSALTRNGDNDFTITWVAAPTDEYGVAGNLNIIGAKGTVNGAIGGCCTDQPLDTNSDTYFEEVRMRIHDLGTTLTDPVVTVVVYTGQTT